MSAVTLGGYFFCVGVRLESVEHIGNPSPYDFFPDVSKDEQDEMEKKKRRVERMGGWPGRWAGGRLKRVRRALKKQKAPENTAVIHISITIILLSDICLYVSFYCTWALCSY